MKKIKKRIKYQNGGPMESTVEETPLSGDPGDPLSAPALKKKYSSNPYLVGEGRNRYFWATQANREFPITGGNVSEAVRNAAKLNNVDPAILYASAMEEGMSGAIDTEAWENASVPYVDWTEKNPDLAQKFPVDGFYNYGLDQFPGQVKTLQSRGYLPKDFNKNFTTFNAVNENKEKVTTAAFDTDANALIAKSAMLRLAQDQLDSYVKSSGANLTDKQRQFFILANYNGGEGNMRKMIESYNQKGYLKNDDFLNTSFNPASYGEIYKNVMARIQSADMLRAEKVFNYGGKLPKNPAKIKKYQFGTEEPIDPITGVANPNNVGVNAWGNAMNTPTPINPDAPKNQQIFRLDNEEGTPTSNQRGIVPLSQFYDQYADGFGNQQLNPTGNYVNEQGQTNTVQDQQISNNKLSQQNRENADQTSRDINNIELVASTGITAINSFFNRRNAAQQRRTDYRKAIMDETFGPTINPYAEGTGSQAIMRYGGPVPKDTRKPKKEKPFTLYQPKDVVRTYKFEDKREINPVTGKPFKVKGGKTVDVNESTLRNVIKHAKAQGVDPYTALAIAMQETGIGAIDSSDLGRAIDADFDTPSSVPESEIHAYDLAKTIKTKMDYGRTLMRQGKVPEGEDFLLQAYNGYGKLSPKTERSGAKAFYELPVSSDNPLDLKKNPAYGKTVLSLREEVIKKNPDIQRLIDQTEAVKYESGGKIHIKPENKGKFTAAANRAGKSVQSYAAQIMANPDNYSPTLVKRANFARNAAKWHEFGGEIEGDDLGITTLDGGKSEMVSTSNHSNPMVEFKGRTHEEGGIGIQFGENIAEVEDKEIGWIDDEGSLNIFGKLKIPGTGKTARNMAKDLATQESKIDGKLSKYLNILNNSNPVDPYQESAQSTAKVMFKSLDKQAQQIAEQKQALASFQNLILGMANPEQMKYGGKMPTKPKGLMGNMGLMMNPEDDIYLDKRGFHNPAFGRNLRNTVDINNFNTGDFQFSGGLRQVPLSTFNQQTPQNFNTGDFQFNSTLTGGRIQKPSNFNTGDFQFKSTLNRVPMTPKVRTTTFNTGDFESTSTIQQLTPEEIAARRAANQYQEGGIIGAEDDPIKKAKLKRNFNKDGRDLSQVKSVILHKTAGTGNAAGIIAGWDSGDREASADFIIDKDGTITQVGELQDTKWHSGRRDVNQTAFGVEIVGASADESDMTPQQFAALKQLNDEVFAPMGISPNDYFGHTQVNKKKGFDFANPQSIGNVLSRAGIANEYTANTSRYFGPNNYQDPNVVRGVSNLGTEDEISGDPNAVQSAISNSRSAAILNYKPNFGVISTGSGTSTSNNFGMVDTPYGPATRNPTPFSNKTNIGTGGKGRGTQSPLAFEQIAPELIALATNTQDPVNQLTYQPDLKQTFDISYQLGRNENQATFNQVAQIAEQTGNVGALSQLAAEKYKADQQYNMQEIQGNAQQRLQTYNANIDTLNDARLKNLALIADQQTKQAQADFNTRRQTAAAISSLSSKVLQNQLENRTYNAYANLFKHYGFDSKGNVTFRPDEVAQKFTAGEAQQFGLMAAQQGANAIMSGDFNRKFTKVKNPDGSQTTTETLGNNRKIQDEYKTLKAQGFDDSLIGNMLRAKYPETIND